MLELLMILGNYAIGTVHHSYALDNVGVDGFSGYSVVVEAPVETPEAPAIVPDTVEQAIEARQQPQAASRNSSPADVPVEFITRPEAPTAPSPVGGITGIASQYVGYPYVLGGTPPATFDCSSYVWYVYQQAGIDIPRSVNGQASVVTPVSDPQPGDLIFYNDFHHVGIYAGNGMTYEAANPGDGVRYGTLFSNNVWYGRIG